VKKRASPGDTLRIGITCPYSLSLPGGVQGQVLALARSLRRRGHETRVLAPCDGPPPAVFVTPVGMSIPTSSNGSVAPVAPDPSAALRTIRALWDEDFDVIHAHEPLVPGPSLTTVLVKPAPIVGTWHAAGSQPHYKVWHGLANWAAGRIDRRVAVSADAADLAAEHLPGDYDLLFNGIELDRFRAAAEAAAATPSAEAPTVFFLGRHEERKGLAVLLEASRSLPSGTRIWVAGNGPQTDELKARYPDEGIVWLGRIDDDERDRRIAEASVFCAPSLGGESFGVILLEAMAAGTPVVASDIPGYSKVACGVGPDGEAPERPAALLVPPDDPSSLAAALTVVMTDSSAAAELSAIGNRRAAVFDLERLTDRYLAMFQELVG